MSRSLLIGVWILLACLAVPPVTSADSDEDVRAKITDLRLDPSMLYPTSLPARLADADASLSLDGEVAVSWDRGAAENGLRTGWMGLSQRNRSALASDLRTSRRRGYRPRRTKIGTRRVWRICGHVCGYAWTEDRRTYSLYGVYYIGDEDGQALDRDMRFIVRRLAPIG